ncbi:hypothetical protein CCR75_007894 [Bremia lactucae]|uniref:Homologous recombination OB-fold protein OB-fold domain-containing protein n=1 Tax=Bremia lactucae TaxID=4779 RepID=A0A976FHV9_BRELC|nr:hypothetical protein CCR75_007894 [Bremia lactucae]
MRQVPGPLQELLKKRADQMENSQGDYNRVESANSDQHSATIATIFDQGPWVEMCQYLGMPAVSGQLYGSVRVGNLMSIGSFVEVDEALTMIHQLLVLIKSMRYVDEDIVAVLHDPTGEIEGYFHKELVEQVGPALVAGVGVLLNKVSVFTPTDAPVTGRRKSYLNITPRNLRRIFATNEQNRSNSLNIIELFNKEKEIESSQESDHDDYDNNFASRSEVAARQLLKHSTVRDTSAELSFLSQRQVIHRNPPVRVDPTATSSAKKEKGMTNKRATFYTSNESGNGLGKWQWSQLLRKTTNVGSNAETVRVHERECFMDASSRLVSLITKQQNAKSRTSSILPLKDTTTKDAFLPADLKSKELFALKALVKPPTFLRNSKNNAVREQINGGPSLELTANESNVQLDGNNSDEVDDNW